MDAGLRHGFRLHELWVDPEHHRIGIAGRGTELSQEALDFLLLLVESPDDLIPTERLFERLHVQSPAELDRCYDEVQAALGDSPTSPRFVRKDDLGFQLIAPVSIDVPPEPTTDRIL
jgi:DNA-binding winged helix-turn-helix (wHTH) protein